ncbi:class I SAM-dependent methyltransferase [Burkholderia diffusa]|uniref:class I SAM-dependent methyltransferase n=1 Tax=Burkholderia diffusa TaxID=488732 RepID=UPI00264DF395|nr:class I SAM-dependent methyltransferase [Burkholderia diffusa]MDN7906895.1 class I SAM-dependent methyltransferase [Burkholderia diffusa]
MKMSGGMAEQGIVVGNNYDKYGSTNPIVRHLMRGFDDALTDFVTQAAPSSIHEIGCGEGYWVLRWRQQGLQATGSDFSARVIELAQENAVTQCVDPAHFSRQDVYRIGPQDIQADLVVCCEVLEHLEQPEVALRNIEALGARHVIFSVPREPIWSAMNLARGKYISALGNTPGHIQRWSKRAFIEFVSTRFDILSVRTPLPWTMLLCRPRSAAR